MTSVSAWAPPRRAAAEASRLSLVITATASASGGVAEPALQRGGDGPDAQRLGQHQHVAGAGARVGQDRVRMDDAGDRHSKFGLRVLNRVTAKDRHASLLRNRAGAPQDFQQHVLAEVIQREGDQVQRTDRRRAHRVDVRQRVGGSDPPEVEWVIDDRGEEVDRVHQREVLTQPVHAGVVRVPVADEDIRVLLAEGQPGQQRCDRGGGELAAAAGAMGERSQRDDHARMILQASAGPHLHRSRDRCRGRRDLRSGATA